MQITEMIMAGRIASAPNIIDRGWWLKRAPLVNYYIAETLSLASVLFVRAKQGQPVFSPQPHPVFNCGNGQIGTEKLFKGKLSKRVRDHALGRIHSEVALREAISTRYLYSQVAPRFSFAISKVKQPQENANIRFFLLQLMPPGPFHEKCTEALRTTFLA